jgi:hypothetical protein
VVIQDALTRWRFAAREVNLRIVILIAMLLGFPSKREVTSNQEAGSSRAITIRIPLSPGPEPEEISVLTFDPARVSAKELEKWTLFHENARFTTPLIGASLECKPSDIFNLQDEIKKTEELLVEIDGSDHPKELDDVVRFVKDRQLFWVWMARQELEFLTKGRLPALKYKDWDLSACQVAPVKEKICFQVFYDWANCANNEQARRLGPYPTDKWKAFLDALGVQERMETGIPE